VDKLVARLLAQPQLGLRLTKKWLNQYLQQQMNTFGAGTLAAEALVLASDEFKESILAMGRQVEEQKKIRSERSQEDAASTRPTPAARPPR